MGGPVPPLGVRRAGFAAAALVVGLAVVLMRSEAGEGFAALANIALAVIWAALWWLAALGAGSPLTGRLADGSGNSLEDHVISGIAGTGVLVACAWVLSLLGLFRPWPLLLVALAWAGVGAATVRRHGVSRPPLEGRSIPLLGLAAIALLVAATISPFYDQWHQHLGFPWMWLQDGSIHALPRNWYSYMPVNSSLLFAYGLGTLGPWSAQVIHWWCGVLTVLGVLVLARRAASRAASTWAVWLLATSPTLLHAATTAGSDLVISMFAAGAWIGLLRSADERGRATWWWTFAGICVGLAVGTKYTAIGTVAIPAAVGALVLHRPRRGDHRLKELAIGSAVAAGAAIAVFAPWAIRNIATTGNPLFPFVNAPFRATLKVPWESVERFSTWLSGFDLSTRHLVEGLDLGTFRRSMDGFPSVGIAFLALVLVTAVCWRRLPRPSMPALAAGAVVGAAFWVVSMHANRYLLPTLVPASVVLGSAVAATAASVAGRVRTGVLLLMGLAFTWNLATSVSSLGLERLGCTFGVVRLEPMLSRLVSSSPAFEAVAELPAESKILLVAESRALGFDRPVELEHPFGEPRLLELARLSRDHGEMARRLVKDGITHVFANGWESRRISAMGERKRYFEPSDTETADRLDRFCRECLAAVWTGRGLALYELVPTCDATPPGAAELSSW